MTNPTADAAKLRDDLIKLLAHIEDGPYIGAEGVADDVLNWVAENIADLSRELARGTLQDSRPHPAPPEGEPPLSEIADLIQGYISTTRDVASMAARAISDHLGLAARSKVEDVEVG